MAGASRVPDVAVYRWARIPRDDGGEIKDDFLEPPDIAIEIMSPRSGLTVHLISVLQRQGLTLETAVWIGSFFGPMQVLGRILEFSVGRRFA